MMLDFRRFAVPTLAIALCALASTLASAQTEGPHRRLSAAARQAYFQPEETAGHEVVTTESPPLDEGSYVYDYGAGFEPGCADGCGAYGGTGGSYGGACGAYGGSCGPECCSPCCLRLYGSVEALLWWSNGDRVPALVTTSPAGTSFEDFGALDQPTTEILFGNECLGDSLRPGMRFVLGTNCSECTNLEFSYLTLFEENDHFSHNSEDVRNLARPFLNINDAEDDVLPIAFFGDEGELTGSIAIRYESEFQGGGVLVRHRLLCIENGCCRSQLHILGGYRYLSLRETLRFRSRTTVVEDPGQTLEEGTEFSVAEAFGGDNVFHGGDLGLAATFGGPCTSLELFGKVAVGSTREEIAIRGRSSTSVPDDGTETELGGLLAQPSNIGKYERSESAFVPEVGAKLAWRVNQCWQFTTGYSFLFWSGVSRPGEQVDLALNETQLDGGEREGASRPEFAFIRSNYWAHGLSLGLECKY